MAAPLPVPETEATMLDALANRYAVRSQGVPAARYAFATHVRSGAGFGDHYSVRTADAVAMDLWPSSGLLLHGHEVKVTRSDWLAELRDPTKCEGVKRYMDYWWLVVPDTSIVRPGELPDGWGLMVLTQDQTRTRWVPERRGYEHYSVRSTRVTRQARRLKPVPVGRSFMAALLRAVAKTTAAKGRTP